LGAREFVPLSKRKSLFSLNSGFLSQDCNSSKENKDKTNKEEKVIRFGEDVRAGMNILLQPRVG
jgi:hypothetical protein